MDEQQAERGNDGEHGVDGIRRADPADAMTSPHSAGPVTNASAWFVDEIVTARGKKSRDTMLGRNAARAGASNTLALEMSATTPYTKPSVAVPRSVTTHSTTMHASDADWEAA
jgi:hypothetical protein